MKRIKAILAATVFSLGLMVGVSAPVFAAETQTDLQCLVAQNDDDDDDDSGPVQTASGCDLAIDVQVSVNGSDFVDDTAATEPSVNIGDTITWKLIVSDNSTENESATGLVTVENILPEGVSFVSGEASGGAYESGSNTWILTAENDLTATLTLTSTAVTSGSVSDSASFTDYLPDMCGGEPCLDPPYFDANAANNSHAAFAFIKGKLVAVTTPTTTSTTTTPHVPDTGFGVAQRNVAATAGLTLLTVSGLAAAAYGLRRRVQHRA